nr:hypothetical protein [Tanacetum cinerariifolium]
MTIGTPKYTNVYVSPSARYVKGDLDEESFRLTAFMQLSALHYKRRASNMIDRWLLTDLLLFVYPEKDLWHVTLGFTTLLDQKRNRQ